VPEAETGRLLVMVGAKPEILEEHRALLETFGQVIHCGGVGSGAAMKLVANASLVGGMAVLGEVLALARAMGLAEGPTFDVVIQTPAGKILERKGDYIRSGHHEPANFPLRLAAKDSGLVGEVVEELGLTSPAIDAARRWLEKARELGLGEMDYSAVVEAIKQAGPRD
jgi:3-hydroxyisobutyrate dehydrogenase-like beta-hydroxyacid dehydrogenase